MTFHQACLRGEQMAREIGWRGHPGFPLYANVSDYLSMIIGSSGRPVDERHLIALENELRRSVDRRKP